MGTKGKEQRRGEERKRAAKRARENECKRYKKNGSQERSSNDHSSSHTRSCWLVNGVKFRSPSFFLISIEIIQCSSERRRPSNQSTPTPSFTFFPFFYCPEPTFLLLGLLCCDAFTFLLLLASKDSGNHSFFLSYLQ
jgi:hypothetical protein